jgi:hypothetical protein
MNASTRNNILLFVGAVFGYCGLFHQVVGLPDWVQIPFALVFVVCLWLVVSAQRRARKSADPSPGTATPAEDQRFAVSASRQTGVRLFMLFLIIVVSLSGPWWLPYTGVHLAFPQLVTTSLLSCVICVAIWLIGWRRSKPKA